ncbi:MAG TPA: ABC transporter ATP-binding protein [Candidatus Hydrogenedentes bacterium]|jgi:ABC-2 type transport system ATP-binding protein|nr:ABC transporter ATP-binding protein [Candidatus Hydrogenedentota bacterium]HOH41466.1 ABC transporter ATP-binding protein [Candidatus Hydrogenedentota bacterium]HPX86994.1 ABC transporter ATP-binding protein [Candidatus Hydrogenedentota bacterium]
MSPIIEACGLSKWFGEVVALNNLDIALDSPVTGLLGPNGAGKSTFIKLALGLYSPSKGSIRIFGEAPRNNHRVMRRIGYCPETDYFFENSTGFEFVYWLNRYWGMQHRQAVTSAEAACDLVNMTERMHDAIDTYSKGMRQRIKIAQALTGCPELLFLDEPMNGLDPKGREEMYLLIQKLAGKGMTVVVSSHILYEIERITDTVVLIYGGTLLAQGRVRDIRDLIDKYPQAIRIRTTQARTLAERFITQEAVSSLEIEENSILVRTRDPNFTYEMLNSIALEDAELIQGIACSDDNLQSVFDYLTR